MLPMAEHVELGNLGTSDFDQLQELADRFEKAWRQDPSVDLAAFVPPREHPLRQLVLQELIKIDLEMRWQRGTPIEVEVYLQQYPELAADRHCLVTLLYEEWHVRQMRGDESPLAVYQARFPEHFEDLERFVQRHLADERTPNPTAVQTPSPFQVPRTSQGEVLGVGGGYRLVERIGTGGFGEVWKAEAPGGIQVALKIIMRPLENQEVHRELEALELIKGLRHQFLLQTQAFWPLHDRL